MRSIVYLNECNFGSTGSIIRHLSQIANDKGFQTYFCYPKTNINKLSSQANDFMFGNILVRNIETLINQHTGHLDSLYFFSTHKLIKELESIKPDCIHIHNLHGNFINVKQLFNYIKEKSIPVIWTLHDCWPFTGRCPHFLMNNCQKWMSNCSPCDYNFNDYPKSRRDKSAELLTYKRNSFCGVNKLVLVTPSQWLASLIPYSILKEYPTQVINNGIDLEVFQPTKSTFKERNNINRYMVLGVSNGWSNKKGLDVFIELASKLGDDYKIVLVGTDAITETLLPNNIIPIRKTQNQKELAELYSQADVFINPTREDTFPTVNIEALACGCPVITFDTGGSPEILNDLCGRVVPQNSVSDIVNNVYDICERKSIIRSNCTERSKSFNKNDRFRDYLNLYESVISSNY